MKSVMRFWGLFFAIMAAMTYGLNPLFGKPLLDAGMPVSSVLLWRYGVGLIMVTGMLLVHRGTFKMPWKNWCFASLNGILMALSSVALYKSFTVMEVGLASTLLFTYPILTAIIMGVFFKEKAGVAMVISILLSVLGVCALNGVGATSFNLPLDGFIYVMISSVLYAVYLVIVRVSALKNSPSDTLTFWAIAWGVPVLFLMAQCNGGVACPRNMMQWGCVLGMGIFPTFISLVFTAFAIKSVGATVTAILGALEPMTAVAIGVIAFDEKLTLNLCLGMLLIASAVILVILTPGKAPKKELSQAE